MARLYHRLLAAVFVIAWVSLATQVEVLIGKRGLLPVTEIAERAPSFWQFPSLFALFTPADRLLVAGAWFGAGLSMLALLGFLARACIGVSTFLYLTYALACRDFCSFQWDNLLLECGALAILLPRDRPAPWIHVLFRLLLLKLYFESGIAKWQSVLGDWKDGSAMTYYYETAPLPTPLAWVAHHLPVWWHHIESWGALVMELGVPFLAFGPRVFRLTALVLLTGFQLVNFATANYGFFVPLALALHAFLIEEDTVESWRGRLHLRELPVLPAAGKSAILALIVFPLWLIISICDGIGHFHDPSFVVRWAAPFRLINTYHLFGHITRERIEPQFQVSTDGETWVEHDLRYKPGDPDRAPPFVAPHQPRVDFQLWFYGLEHQRGVPRYVQRLLQNLCRDPGAVQPLFLSTLPEHPRAVRLLFYRYHMGKVAWWTREPLATAGPYLCP